MQSIWMNTALILSQYSFSNSMRTLELDGEAQFSVAGVAFSRIAFLGHHFQYVTNLSVVPYTSTFAFVPLGMAALSKMVLPIVASELKQIEFTENPDASLEKKRFELSDGGTKRFAAFLNKMRFVFRGLHAVGITEKKVCSLAKGIDTILNHSSLVLHTACAVSYIAMIALGMPVQGAMGLAGFGLIFLKQKGKIPHHLDKFIEFAEVLAVLSLSITISFSTLNLIVNGLNLWFSFISFVSNFESLEKVLPRWVYQAMPGTHKIYEQLMPPRPVTESQKEVLAAAAEVKENLLAAATESQKEVLAAAAKVKENLLAVATENQKKVLAEAADVKENLLAVATENQKKVLAEAAEIEKSLLAAVTESQKEVLTEAAEIEKSLLAAATESQKEVLAAAAEVEEKLVADADKISQALEENAFAVNPTHIHAEEVYRFLSFDDKARINELNSFELLESFKQRCLDAEILQGSNIQPLPQVTEAVEQNPGEQVLETSVEEDGKSEITPSEADEKGEELQDVAKPKEEGLSETAFSLAFYRVKKLMLEGILDDLAPGRIGNLQFLAKATIDSILREQDEEEFAKKASELLKILSGNCSQGWNRELQFFLNPKTIDYKWIVHNTVLAQIRSDLVNEGLRTQEKRLGISAAKFGGINDVHLIDPIHNGLWPYLRTYRGEREREQKGNLFANIFYGWYQPGNVDIQACLGAWFDRKSPLAFFHLYYASTEITSALSAPGVSPYSWLLQAYLLQEMSSIMMWRYTVKNIVNAIRLSVQLGSFSQEALWGCVQELHEAYPKLGICNGRLIPTPEYIIQEGISFVPTEKMITLLLWHMGVIELANEERERIREEQRKALRL